MLQKSLTTTLPSTQLQTAVLNETGCSVATYQKAYKELVNSKQIVKKPIQRKTTKGAAQWFTFLADCYVDPPPRGGYQNNKLIIYNDISYIINFLLNTKLINFVSRKKLIIDIHTSKNINFLFYFPSQVKTTSRKDSIMTIVPKICPFMQRSYCQRAYKQLTDEGLILKKPLHTAGKKGVSSWFTYLAACCSSSTL